MKVRTAVPKYLCRFHPLKCEVKVAGHIKLVMCLFPCRVANKNNAELFGVDCVVVTRLGGWSLHSV